MRFPPVSLKIGWKWWLSFGLLIAMPAFALALLGLRAVHAERIEREQRLREQQAQASRLADAAIANALETLEGELRRADEASQELSNLIVFSFNRDGLISFHQDRVYFDEQSLGHNSRTEWSLETELLIEQAQMAEAQQRLIEAAMAYRKLVSLEPKLRDWAEFGLARIRYQSGDPRAEALLVSDRWGGSEGITPMGLPVAFVACSYVERLPHEKRASLIPLLEETILRLRGGQWWLSYETRRFYDRELCNLLLSAGSNTGTTEDARLGELADITAIVRRSPPPSHNLTMHSFERGERSAFLILCLPSSREADMWIGLAIPRERLATLLDEVVGPILAGQALTAAIRDAQGGVLWGSDFDQFHSESLRAVPGWEMNFSGPATAGWVSQKQWLWFGFIMLLVLMLVVGLAMTAHVVRREMELAHLQNEFIAAVSHEFKSPLTSIRLLMERITGGRLQTTQAVEQYYAAIDRETQRLERLVNRLLEAQALQTGRKRYSFTRASIVEVAEAAINGLRPQAEARGIGLEARTEGVIPELQLDRAVMTDAIENLLDNAIKYSPSGASVTIAIRADENQVCIDVCDTGIGIDQNDLPRIFDRFYRGRRGDQQDVKGAGLGLALVKVAVEAHGGMVDVTSTPGKGSRFSLRLSINGGDEHNGARSDS
ncbi:MAG: HAMP domain-containing sensor histidine kinase [Acidobacteriota bacterium]